MLRPRFRQQRATEYGRTPLASAAIRNLWLLSPTISSRPFRKLSRSDRGLGVSTNDTGVLSPMLSEPKLQLPRGLSTEVPCLDQAPAESESSPRSYSVMMTIGRLYRQRL